MNAVRATELPSPRGASAFEVPALRGGRLPLPAALSLAALSGLLLVATFPPYDVWPLAFVALAPLLVAIHGRSPKEAALVGWTQGMVAHVVGDRWLPGVVRTFGQLPWVVCTLLGLAVCAYSAGRMAIFAGLVARATRKGWPRGVVVVLAFGAIEAVYPLLFPYCVAGGLNAAPLLLQLAELGGGVLVGVPLAMASVAVAEPAWARLEGRRVDRRRVGVALLGPAAMLLFGVWRMDVIRDRMAVAPPVVVGIVQGNTPHEGLALRDAMVRYRSLTGALVAKQKLDLVVWPETALSGVVPQARLESVLREATDDAHGARLLTPLLAGTFVEREGEVTNSAVLFADRRVQGTYDKREPLAFGEYIPFGDTFPKLYDWIKNAGHLARGTSDAPLVLGDHRISTLICYEDILPGLANRTALAADPDLLVNMTNDSWFGDSPVAGYHLALAKLRAVEHRRYLVHATNSGRSAFVDPTGVTTGETPLFAETSEAETLHWMRGRTVYERLGDRPWWGAAVLVVALGFVRRRSRVRTSADLSFKGSRG
jgi:apolipoprotein N-acyltransferase